ncbi:MAG: FGGY-family carbohydrate kinase [Treponema sp.]|jgi:xylulokinase|nr:FGGY-family carbohydrate kinase [Treponema sp.]
MLLTIDIGTSNFKSALWDYNGNRLGFASAPMSQDGDSSQWLRGFRFCCLQLGNQDKIKTIVISGNGPTLVPVLLNGNTSDARLWFDRGAEEYQDEVSKIMGGFVDAAFFLPKVLMIKNEEEDLYRHTKYFLGCPEYLAYKLTNCACSVFPSDGFDRWFWNDEVLKKLGLDKSKFPPFIRPGNKFGVLSEKVADKFGFNKNIPVISGGPDFYAAIIGAGITKPGEALDRTGSSEGINLCTENCVNADRLMSYGHPIKPYWNLSGKIDMSGFMIEQTSEILGLSNIKDFFAVARESENSTQRETANAVLQELCYKVKEIIDKMEETGVKINLLRVTGGISANDYMNQLKADITGKEIQTLHYKEAELLGCAIIGSCFLGKYSSFNEACAKLVKIEKKYLPNS